MFGTPCELLTSDPQNVLFFYLVESPIFFPSYHHHHHVPRLVSPFSFLVLLILGTDPPVVPLLSRALHRIRSTPPRIITSPPTRSF
jgi:hypothetical protein